MNHTAFPLTVEAMGNVLMEHVIVTATGREVPVISFSAARRTVVVMGGAPRVCNCYMFDFIPISQCVSIYIQREMPIIILLELFV